MEVLFPETESNLGLLAKSGSKAKRAILAK